MFRTSTTTLAGAHARASRPWPAAAVLAALVALALGASAHTGGHQVQPGDTLTAIAARHGVSVAALAEANGLPDPDHIRIGQTITIPGGSGGGGGGSHEVQPGETLSAIAARHGVSVAALAEVNGLASPHWIVAGRSLAIPAPGSSGGGGGPASEHVVEPGDTLIGLAARYGLSPAALADANGLGDANLIRIGQRLAVPAAGAASSLPSRLRNSPERLALIPHFDHWAATYGVPADLLKAMTWMESGWQSSVTSSTGAMGVGQLMPATVDFVGGVLIGEALDPRQPEDNIRMSARYLRWLLDRSGGDTRRALASYYQGPAAVDQRGVYPSTVTYVDAVLGLRTRFST